MIRIIFRSKKKKIIEERRKLNEERVLLIYYSLYDEIKDDEIHRTCSRHDRMRN
jgi:hypothetical protein